MGVSTIIEIFATLFITIDPPGVIGPYMSLTSRYDHQEKQTILRQAILFSFIVLISCIFIGKAILDVLGISLFALQIAGGILFFKFGYDTMNGTSHQVSEDDSPGFVPLGFPIIAGPGSITATIILSSTLIGGSQAMFHGSMIVLAVFSCLLITYLMLRHSGVIIRSLGDKATKAIIKIIGLLIMSIGIQLILVGLQQWMTGFNTHI
ncbi:MAG: MarC family protein [Candidatus Kariarchaeaceae archaeon]|jgi:multiple antibiotic resistance protein